MLGFSDMVFRQVVLVELCLIIFLSSATLILQIPLFLMKSLHATWKQSPVLSIFLGSIPFLAIMAFLYAFQWILFVQGAITNGPENAVSIVVIAHVGSMFRHFHNSVTVALFAQRVFFVLCPLKPIRKFNYFVLTLMGILFAVDCIGATYIIAVNIQTDGMLVSEG
uniref:G protein-coupled receptor n=1 Tax=Steinernema glaseri TaxID=37863 RepID=A0A1I7Y0F4_9BILA